MKSFAIKIIGYKKKQIQNKQNKASSFNILLIDDNEDILYVFSDILKREGYNTISYSDPIEAWTHFSNSSPYYFDLILTDIRMPGINGIKLYFKFKTINPDVKILFISALDAAEELLSIFPDVENTDFIRKPVERKYLLSKIKSILSL
jgi:two-component system response regulator ChvI